jgi:hypothetical protein
MKLFQQLLVAPAALGLLSPFAANAADLNLSGVNQYASKDQVTSINQFSDVNPSDWAYQALSNLIEQYGCVAGYPDGTYRGQRAMTRYEAAALLNACLDRITEITDELKKLMKEFEKELAVVRGRVDGLEAKVGELEATQFSTTTKLKADTRWVVGALNYSPNDVITNNAFTPSTLNRGGLRVPQTETVNGVTRPVAIPLRDAVSFNYDVRLNFDTSFTGKDLLKTQLRAGNFADSGFSNSNLVSPLANLDAAFEENCGTGVDCGDVVAINRLYYRFPIGSSFTAIIGGRMRQDDGLAVKPSVYTADKILKFWDFNGAPGAYSQVLGGGAGLWWKQPGKTGFSFGGVYVSGNADAGNPNGDTATNSYSFGSAGGIGNIASQQSGTLQLAYTGNGWNLTGAYTYNSAGVNIAGTSFSQALLPSIYRSNIGGGQVNSWSIAGYWQPINSGWIPSLSAGWGLNNYIYSGDTAGPRSATYLNLDSATSQSWYVGLNWKDLFWQGNALGFAVGQPTFITALSQNGNDIDTYDGNYAFELYYKFQVTDNIAVTPAIFWLSRPRGQYTSASSLTPILRDAGFSNDDSLGTLGGLVQTTFRF